MRASLTLLLVVLASAFRPAQTTSVDSGAVTRMERKLERIKSNGALPHPDQTPTDFTEHEINSYLASGKVKLPVGVRSVHLEGQPQVCLFSTGDRATLQQFLKLKHVHTEWIVNVETEWNP